MKWTVATARQRFSQLLVAAAKEPQRILNRNREVAAVVAPEQFDRFALWLDQQESETIADAFEHVRQICAEEGYRLPAPARRDRPNPFARGAR